MDQGSDRDHSKDLGKTLEIPDTILVHLSNSKQKLKITVYNFYIDLHRFYIDLH